MNRKQITAATFNVLTARLNYLEAISSGGGRFRDYAEYDAIREELDTRTNMTLDQLDPDGAK